MRFACVLAAVFVSVVASASAQQKLPAAMMPAGAAPSSEPFGFVQYGAFKQMMHTRDFAAKTTIGRLIADGATDAVGAVDGLRGEITAIDGKFIVSYGHACSPCRTPGAESAALLSTARVKAWHSPVTIARDMTSAELDAFIVARAKEVSIATDKAFPIRLVGTLTDVTMHVLKGPAPQHAAQHSPPPPAHGAKPAPQTSGSHAMAVQDVIVAKQLNGTIVGFFAPPALQGVATHPGEPFHYHWVDDTRTKTTHLDAFGIVKGALLILPASQ